MTQEEKSLLLKDLCARLPYGVKCCDFCYDDEGDIVNTIETLECIYPSTMEYKYKDIDAKHDIERIKPYLRPMSSMTDEEKETYDCFFDENGSMNCSVSTYIDWLLSCHFDFRGLIPKGLALEAPEEMYNTKTE